ncbi:HFX_2341 family transcriptional regulator domain-containing protein [Halobellus inordinatus]|uniref:HFX_2341 family transcriptional regulator domain-containing protein n=1 Tax=Halobellus inordinatus TaxID=1126236 RepID=UPI00211479DC|nr:DUF6293 family protein [Halobellus ramosii]
MDIADRVQIVPLGYEYARAWEPIQQYKADTVVLLRHRSDQDYEADFQRELVTELRSNDRIALETQECDLFDLNSAVSAFVEAIERHSTDEVLVNVATGSKITAIAGMMACQSTSATPFYVTPEFRADGETREPPSEPLVDSVGDIFDLPVFQLQAPTSDQMQILEYLAECDGATKKSLIQYGRDQGLSFIVNSESKSEEGLYRLLKTHIIDPLSTDNYVTVKKDGRKKRVYLTERGHDALRLFPQPDKTKD